MFVCFGIYDILIFCGYYEGVDIDWWVWFGWIVLEEKVDKLMEWMWDVDVFMVVVLFVYRDILVVEGFWDVMYVILVYVLVVLVVV